MADRVLFLCAHLSKRLAKGIEPEEGIVAEAGITPGIKKDLAGAISRTDNRITCERLSLGDDTSYRTNEGGASVADALKIFEKLFVISLIIAGLPRISCGVNAGLTIQGIYNKPRVVCNRAKAGKFGSGTRLDECVFFEGSAVFLDLTDKANVIERNEFDLNILDILGKKLLKLCDLSAIF